MQTYYPLVVFDVTRREVKMPLQLVQNQQVIWWGGQERRSGGVSTKAE